MSENDAVKEVVNILRAEFTNMREHVQELSLGLARLEERIARSQDMAGDLTTVRSSLERVHTRLAVITGESGKNGKVGDLEIKVNAHEKQLSSLLLSRALLAGYALAGGGIGAVVAKFLF